MRVGWLAMALLLAGCSQAAEPPGPTPGPDPMTVYARCPPEEAAPSDAWAAPAWRVGDHWNYTVWRGDEVEGWENSTVVAVGPVGSVSACGFHVENRNTNRWASDADHPQGGAMNARLDTYDARTLSVVWDHRPDCAFLMGDCFGSAPWPYQFPLWDGKAWQYPCCGDVIMEMHGSVEVSGAKTSLQLHVLHSDHEGDRDDHARNEEVFHYSPSVGNVVAWERLQGGEVVERKVLDTYRYQATDDLID